MYSFMLAFMLCSDQLVVETDGCFVPNGGATECPLVDKLCNIKTHNMVEGCFYCLIFTF